MPWMGPIPAKFDEEKLLKQSYAVLAQMTVEVERAPIILNKFKCKRPEFFGPVPRMDLVRAFLHASPDGDKDEGLVNGLSEAAAAGNWMAKVQLYNIMRANTKVAIYRQIQTAQWMHLQKLGPIYALMAASREDSIGDRRPDGLSKFEVYAAFHGSYAAQYKVGKILVENPFTAEVGRAMLDCASNTVPEYGRIFSGEAKRASQQRQQDKIDARLPPLQRAISHGNFAEAARLIKDDADSINTVDVDGHNPLDVALLSEPPDPRIVALLIAKGVQVSEEHSLNPRSYDTQLRTAIKATEPLNLELVKLLMAAGANPFLKNKTAQELYQTPFTAVAEKYAHGGADALFDFMLSTGRLSATSALATAYADHFGNEPRVLDRLLDYGVIPSGRLFVQGAYVTQERQAAWISEVRKLLNSHADLRLAMSSKDGAFALANAAKNCEFTLALALADMGAPLQDGIVNDVTTHCDDSRTRRGDTGKSPRRAFIELLASRNYDLNSSRDDCVAWLPRCELPGNEIVRELLEVGADPYRFGSEGTVNGVVAAINDCNPEIAELMLASPPRHFDEKVSASLTLAAERIAQMRCCADAKMQKILARLNLYGAPIIESKAAIPCKRT